MAYDENLAKRIRAALASRSDVVEKHMLGGIAFMVRGRMSVGIVGSALMLRVDPAEADDLLRKPHVRPMDFTGRPMKGFLYVDPRGIASAPALRGWIARATAFAESQPARMVGKPGAKNASRKPVARKTARRLKR